MRDFLTLDTLALRGKRVLLRADLNVPVNNGKVTDNTRLTRLLVTLEDLAKADAKIVILSHFGRPSGGYDPEFSLRPVVAALQDLWAKDIAFAEDCIGPKAEFAVNALQVGQILVLENTRFHKGEEANDPAFAQALASLGDVYVNDAFSCAHRAHASTEGLAKLLPAAAGRLMQAELEALAVALHNPQRPLAAIVGGSKISTKLELLNNLIAKTDILILGGGMANTFLAAQGLPIGKSISEPSMYVTAQDIRARANQRGCHILLPRDVVTAAKLEEGIATHNVPVSDVPEHEMILDLGQDAIKEIRSNLELCKTVLWNGPLGAFETTPFDRATNEVAVCVSDLTKRGKIISVAGGGDTVAAMANAGVTHGMSYLSTAGGAFLEWLEGKDLPGVAALRAAMPKVKTGKVLM